MEPQSAHRPAGFGVERHFGCFPTRVWAIASVVGAGGFGEGVREASVDSAGAAAGLVEVSFLEVVSSDEFNDVLTVREGRKRNEEPETLWGQHDSTQGA